MSVHIRIRPTFLCLLTALLIPAAGAGAAPPVVELPAQAPADRTVELQEVWRLGGEDDEDVLLGVVAQGKIDGEGTTYLLDRQLSQVLVVNSAGELVTTLGREGEGPGELNRPRGLFLMPGGKVGVSQGFPGRITILNPDGTPGGSISIGQSSEQGGFVFVGKADMRAGKLVLSSGHGAFDMDKGKSTTVSSLALFDLQGNELVRFLEHTQTKDLTRQQFDEEKEFSELDTWALGDDVLYTVPDRNLYLINRRNLAGDITAAFRRDFRPRKRTAADKDEIAGKMRLMVNGVEQKIEKHILDNDPAIMSLDTAGDGRLFVGTCYGQRKLLPEDIAGRFDVLDAEGRFLEELTLVIPGFDREQDLLVFLDGRSWLLIRNYDSANQSMWAGFRNDEETGEAEEPEPLEVVLYRMP